MKKNNRGFTLIELLAVIVIMGVLAIMVVPRISDLVMETREEIYVNDAKKLLSQAQYRMSSNSVDIEKPEMGECIIFSLRYLSSNDFRNPPNDGNYLDESSFVVVRNDEGNYEYAVLLIEHRKDGLYQGVEFVTEKQLNARDAIKHVRFFEERELRYIDVVSSVDNNGDFVDTQYINTQLSKSGLNQSNWLEDNSIIGTYNDIKMKEGTIADSEIPRFSAKINSNGFNEEIGGLTANLTVSAIDTDDALNTLKVCVKIERDDKANYPTLATDPDTCEGYGERNYYTKEINFSTYGFTYEEGQIAYIYITVVDPNGNMSRKIVEHTIHQNVGPVISKMEFTRKVGDQVNLPTALLTVDVNDDLDKLEDLKVCFQQDSNDLERCYGEYRAYYDYFDHNNHYTYTFRDENNQPIINPDGSTHSLLMFVKDKDDKVSVATAKYQIFKNESPSIVQATITPATIAGYNSLYFDVNLIVTDDFNENKLMVKVGNEEPMKYADFLIRESSSHSTPLHRAPGFFDGEDREIVIKVWDEFQTEDYATYISRFITNVYQNEIPRINNISIKGKGKLCLDDKNTICTTDGNNENGGSYATSITLDTVDDLLSDSALLARKVKVCVSEDPEYCAIDQPDRFKLYTRNLEYTFSTPENPEDVYANEDTRDLYVTFIETEDYERDSIQLYGVLGPYQYKVYENQAPYFTNSSYQILTAAPYNIANFKDVLTNFNSIQVHDDFNQYTLSFCYSIDGGEEVCTDYLSRNEFISTYGSHFTFKNPNGTDIVLYEGQRIDTHLVAKDHKGLTGESTHFVYTLYSDEAPEIRDVSIRSNSDMYNTNFIYVTLSVVDIGDTYTVCVKEAGKGECSASDFKGKSNGEPFSGDYNGRNPSVATYTFDGVELAGWSANYQEENPNKSLRVWVKDSRGNTVEYGQTISYTLYTSCVMNIRLLRTEYVIKTGEQPLTMNYCSGKCYHESPSLALAANNETTSLFDKKTYNRDYLVTIDCPAVVTDEAKYCDYSTCFETPSNVEPSYIGLTILSPDYVWTDRPDGETMEQLIEKPYCDTYLANNELLFNSRDPRCTDDAYCATYADLICFDEEESAYTSCMNTYQTKCDNALAQFCSRGLDQAMREISCNGANLSDPSIEKHTCDSTFLGGKCFVDDNTCGANNPDCEDVCYEKVNCAPETETVPAVVTCHGYLQEYKRVYRNSKMYLSNTSIKICPEVLNKYPNHYRYDSSSSRPYVLFNEREQISIIDSSVGG